MPNSIISMNKIYLIFFCLFLWVGTFAQDKDSSSSPWFVEPEIMLGKLVPHAPNFPESPLNTAIHLSFGKWNISNEGWGAFYNHPQYGLDIGCHWFGNKAVLGQQFTVMPFIVIPTSNNWKKGVQFKIAGGFNVFTNWYDDVKNPSNKFVGSPMTWSVQMALQKTWSISEKINIKSGINLIHASNSHTTIPNFGLNSIAASFSVQYFNKGKVGIIPKEKKDKYLDKHYYFIFRQGFGYHELGGSTTPVGGNKYAVYNTSISAGILFKKHIRLRSGFTYRNYRSYYNYIQNNTVPEYEKNPIWSSSNILFFVASEFLIGHFGMDVEVGVNLHKPFYKTHWAVFEQTTQFDKKMKGLIAARVGGNFYLFNTQNLPRHNFYIGGFINANFGQADFADFALGYSHRIK